jgi:hypothetical protein
MSKQPEPLVRRCGLIWPLATAAFATMFLTALVPLPSFPADFKSSMRTTHDHEGALAGSEAAFYTAMAKVNARMHQEMEVAPTGDPDRDFVGMMIPHHQGAIDMARVLLKYGRDERLRRLAQAIIVEQGQEIAYMRTFYAAPGTPRSGANHDADR